MVDILSQGEQIKKNDMFINVMSLIGGLFSMCNMMIIKRDREMGSIRRN